MKKVSTHREGRQRYVAPLLEQIDVQIEKGFATSNPGGAVEPMSAGWLDYGDTYSGDE